MKYFLTYIAPIALAGAAILAQPATAQRVSIKADVDSAVMVMGDLNRLHVSVDIPAQYSSSAQLVDFPILTPGAEYLPYGGVDIMSSDSTGTVSTEGCKIDFDFTFQAFDPGTVTLPPFAVIAAPGGDTTFSNVVTFKVLPVDVDSLETIHPMASIVSARSRWYDYVPDWLIWLAVGLAAAGAGVWAYFKFRTIKEEVIARRNPPVPPYELAISRLDTLRRRNLPENGHEREYYTELVDILRDYLHGRFGINAMEMTSTQIVRALRANPETKMTADQMRQVLAMADFVKFAKVRPLPDDNIKAFTRAQDFVEQTKPAPEPEAEADSTTGPKDSETLKNKKK